MHYVYEIYDFYGSVVYVGETADPKTRKRVHTSTKAKSRFPGHHFHIVKAFDNRQEAREYEGILKIEYGIEWTERTTAGKNAKKAVKNGKHKIVASLGGTASAIARKDIQPEIAREVANRPDHPNKQLGTCVHCGKTMTKMLLARYHNSKCKNIQ
jgi:predicted GIY-YIG superfamily endonuclease